MKVTIASVLLAALMGFSATADSQVKTFKGKVDVVSGLIDQLNPEGVLYVHVKRLGQQSRKPVAVIKIENPRYPQEFEIKPTDTMVPGAPVVPFEGPFVIYARHSNTGVPMRPEGFRGMSDGQNCGGVLAGEGDELVVITKKVE